MAGAEVRGIAGQGTIPVVKHLAGNNQENDRQTINVVMDDQTLHESYRSDFVLLVTVSFC
jgi:beta-glucosidase